ncbi:hypothetical protein [Vallicoccus soli]|uniref:DUF559 domain-containing protein n=1 Tax=Vallicoccus soli TaxID=2339232 RepID=A0A3A3Z2R9_9ACTN|nr:hypothetical protein [Vallicoccus soli]RJK97024.1 hypothetical protein D5H78_07300 [Vallicoccus soli]
MPRRAEYDVPALEALLRAQDAVVTHRQLREVGMASGTWGHRTRPGGPWQRLLPGVVLAHGGTPTSTQRARAAVLYGGAGSVLTGAEALRRSGLRAAAGAPEVELLVPHARRRKSVGFVVVERTVRLPRAREVDGVPVAPVARAVIDRCRRLDDLDLVRQIVSEAVQRSRCDEAQLARELRQAQRRGTLRPRAALAEVAAGVRSVAEARARRLLLAAQLPAASWNVDLVDEAGRFVARPDAYWPQCGVALEVDSREWHLSPARWQADQRRRRALASLGVLVLPVTPQQLRDDAASVVEQLRSALAVGAGRPAPAVRVSSGTRAS